MFESKRLEEIEQRLKEIEKNQFVAERFFMSPETVTVVEMIISHLGLEIVTIPRKDKEIVLRRKGKK